MKLSDMLSLLSYGNIKLARSLADYHQARAQLQLLTGTILDEYAVPTTAR